jgi:AmmeMemoRadiSam system protein B
VHSLEVQLPFLQRVCGEFTLLPLVAGDVSPETVATVLEALWNGPETGIVVSTDLSHFHDADTARRLDRHTADRILDFDATLDGEDACGCAGLNGFLLLARHRGLRARTIALSDSSAVSGDESRVVGYGAFAFSVSVPAYA